VCGLGVSCSQGIACDTRVALRHWRQLSTDLKLRSRIRVAVDVAEDEIRRLAQADEKVAQHLNGRQIVKVIVVPQKLINIVVK
jgi:leucyl-tRNA synthetase